MPKSIKKTYFVVPQTKDIPVVNRSGKTAYQRHREMMQRYDNLNPIQEVKTKMTEVDVLKQHHQFLRKDEDETWEDRLARKYYDQLFKEYCLVDLSKYKSGVGMRWRLKQEVMDGKGQFTCGNLVCKESKLYTWEVNFGYIEQNVKKNALVKVRLCFECSRKLHYKKLLKGELDIEQEKPTEVELDEILDKL